MSPVAVAATALSSQLREEVASALGVIGLTVYKVPPPTPVAPCLVTVWDSPMLEPANLSATAPSYRARLRVLCVVDGRNAEAGYLAAETLAEEAIAALPDGVSVSGVTPPQFTDLGAQGMALVAEVQTESVIA